MEIDAPEPRPVRVMRKVGRISALAARSRLRRPVLGDVPVVVSLTSYAHRLNNVGLAIESIGAGRLRPERMVLWVSDTGFSLRDHPHLASLADRGLEVQSCADWRSFKKFYPFVLEGDFSRPLVTADDDIMFPHEWLATLWRGHCETPSHLVGLRGYTMSGGSRGQFAPYAAWPRVTTERPSARTFLTTGSGVVLGPPVLQALAEAGTRFVERCPSADDIWVNRVANTAGTRKRWIRNRHTALNIPGTQQSGALHSENITGGLNDQYLQRLYSVDDVQSVLSDP